MPSSPPAIVADSTISLPASLSEQLPIYTVPFEIHHQGKVYLDGIDLAPGEFYHLLQDHRTLPTTSAPQPGAFLKAFQEAARHTDSVLCLTLSAELSAAHQAALTAQEEARASLPSLEVHVEDTRTAGPAEGLIALEAARLAAGGAPLDQVLAAVRQRVPTVHLLGYMDSLYYVWRGGRVPRVAMWMGHLLSIKPILELSAGHIGMVERPRTRRRAMDRLLALMSERLHGQPARVAVFHAASPEAAQTLAERVQRELSPVELFTTEFTSVIGVHTGPGLVGCAFSPAE